MVVWSTVKELDYPNPTPGRRWYRCCRPKEKKEIRSKREACVCERRKNKNYWIVINGYFFYLEMYFLGVNLSLLKFWVLLGPLCSNSQNN
jgi:hypothetical protein